MILSEDKSVRIEIFKRTLGSNEKWVELTTEEYENEVLSGECLILGYVANYCIVTDPVNESFVTSTKKFYHEKDPRFSVSTSQRRK